MSHEELLQMTTQIVSSYVSNNEIPSSQIPDVIRSAYGALSARGIDNDEAPPNRKKPAVSVRRSVTPDYIVCLEDGKKLKMLKRHTRTRACWTRSPSPTT